MVDASPCQHVLVALLAVLAGCGGTGVVDGPGDVADEPTPTATAAPVPTATADPYPPGVSSGRVDPQVASAAMRTNLRGTSYEWTFEQRGNFGEPSDGSEYVGSRVHAEVGGPAQYVLEQTLLPADGGNVTTLSISYVDGSRVLNYDGETVTARPVSSAQLGYPSRVAAGVAEYLRAQRVETSTLGNGTVSVRGTGSDRPSFSNYSVTALIGPDGTIHRLDATFTRDGRTQSVRFRLEPTHTFEPPAWARDANVTVTR